MPGLYRDVEPLPTPASGFEVGHFDAGALGRVLFASGSVQIGVGTALPLATEATITALVTAISNALQTVDTTAGSASKAAFDTATEALGFTTVAKGV